MKTPALGFVLSWILAVQLQAETPQVIHVFVALADNAHQGIVPVPAKIGDGDKPDDNLYWGCDEGVRSWFRRSSHWKKLRPTTSPREEILERIVFKHASKNAYLIADAWRGRDIKACTVAFANAAAGQGSEAVTADGKNLEAGGAASLIAYIGHNGLMDFTIQWPMKKAAESVPKPIIVLCCISGNYFGPPLKSVGASPMLTTTQLMYPGAFILHDAVETWLGGGEAKAMREAAGRAYAKNQHLSFKSAVNVFTETP